MMFNRNNEPIIIKKNDEFRKCILFISFFPIYDYKEEELKNT